jgi:hypothetical protein
LSGAGGNVVITGGKGKKDTVERQGRAPHS